MNTEKRLAICFALSLLVIIGFSWYSNKKNPQPVRRGAPPTSQQASAPSSQPAVNQAQTAPSFPTPGEGSTSPSTNWSWLTPLAPDQQTFERHDVQGTVSQVNFEEKEIVVESELYRVVFTNKGAIPTSWQLKQYDTLFADPRYLKLKGERLPLDEQEVAKAELGLLEQYRQDGNHHPIEAIDQTYSQGHAGFSIQWGPDRTDRSIPYTCAVSTLSVSEPTDLRFSFENKGIILHKTYRFYPDSYHVDFQIEIENQSGNLLEFSEEDYYDVLWLGGFGFPSLREDAANSIHLELDGSITTLPATTLQSEIQKNSQFLLRDYQSPTLAVADQAVGWVGVGPKYFLAAIVPKIPTKVALKGLSSPAGISSAVYPDVGVRMNMEPIRPKASYTDQFKLYVGPIDEDYLVKAQEGLEDVRQIALRSFIAPIANLMLKLLKGFHFLVPNYGIAIILLTLLVKVLMFPLYHKQMESMRKMQALQPHINALKEQYKDDAQKLQKEQMELFKKHKVNPLAGCLTMLPMLPIFIALYATFGMSVELRGEPFLWWITDLSAPDSAFYLPIGSSIITINILPIAYAILMIWSTSLQKMEGPNATMMKVLPLIFVFIFWNIASGVILYFVVNIFIDLVQRIITEKLYPSEPIPVSGPKKE